MEVGQDKNNLMGRQGMATCLGQGTQVEDGKREVRRTGEAEDRHEKKSTEDSTGHESSREHITV